MKNGGCVRRLESAKNSHDFLKGEKVGYVEEIVNLNVYGDHKITKESSRADGDPSELEKAGSFLKGQLLLSSSQL